MAELKPCNIVNNETGDTIFLGNVEDEFQCQVLALDFVNRKEES